MFTNSSPITWNISSTSTNIVTSNVITTGGSLYALQNSASLSISSDEIIFKPTENKNAIISTNKNKIDIDWLYETVQLLADRFCVLSADPYVLEKYPTLKDAYEQYQILNALIKPNTEKED